MDRFEGLSKHESVCANKTVACLKCGEHVMSRFLQSHYQQRHGLPGGVWARE